MGIDIRPAAVEVVEVLSQNKIPIDLIQSVFQESMRLVNHHTIPYSPRMLRMREEATSEMTDKVTEPNG